MCKIEPQTMRAFSSPTLDHTHNALVLSISGHRPDLYTILEIPQDADLRQIVKAYRKLARVHHPDKGGEQYMFDLIKEAYTVLSDPDKKSKYDRNGLHAEVRLIGMICHYKYCFPPRPPISLRTSPALASR